MLYQSHQYRPTQFDLSHAMTALLKFSFADTKQTVRKIIDASCIDHWESRLLFAPEATGGIMPADYRLTSTASSAILRVFACFGERHSIVATSVFAIPIGGLQSSRSLPWSKVQQLHT